MSHRAAAALISNSLAISQTPAEDARPRTWDKCVARCVYSCL